MPNVLVAKRSDGPTMVLSLPGEVYSGDKVALMQAHLDAYLVRKGLEAGSVTILSAATCDSSLLDVPGTNIDADISIVDGQVANAHA